MPKPTHPEPTSQAAGSAESPQRPPTSMRALVVEDETSLAGLIGSYFERDGFEASVSHDGLQAVALAHEFDPDVVILDLGLPSLDGIEVCRQIRTFSDAYVVMLTARSDEVDTLIGLSVGADDYLTKPFSPRELMARVQALIRRPRQSQVQPTAGDAHGQVRTFGDLSIDVVGREVWLDGEPVALTRTEFDLLAALSARPRMAFSRRQLIDDVWGLSWVGDEHLVDVHIGHLRRKLADDAADSRYVRTVRGIGYRMGAGRERAERGLRGFASRLLTAQALVLVAGAVTTWFVASLVGPGIFREHLRRAGVSHTSAETRHVEEAFRSTLLISLSIALLAATLAALAVTWYFTRRVKRSISQVASAASAVAAGRYEDRVADPGLGVEFATLADSYNALSQRLGSVEATRRRMLADLAHEMRTPLATVDAHLEAVEDGVRSLDENTLSVIRLSTRRLNRLSEDIAAVSQAEEGSLDIHPQVVQAGALAATAVEGAQDRFTARGVGLDTNLNTKERVLADPDRIGQVLGNLLDNALRHTSPGASVTLECRRAGPWVEFVVADSGEGIAHEYLAHVFDRFYRVDAARDRNRGGSGIGLSISKALIEAHGGTLTALSDGSGHGATFIVRLTPAHR